MKFKLKIAIGLMLCLTLIEIAIRLSGIVDFPLYDANNKIGYIPKPNQSGSFLRSHDWQFNSLSMGAPEFKPTASVDVLLIGDSVVLGGNPYRQADRLGPQLQKISGENVWPISAGSWALRNELHYLNSHLTVVSSIDQLIFVLNSADFEEASSWSCEETHPRSHPVYATAYVIKKYLYNWSPCKATPVDLKVPSGDWKAELKEFLQNNPTIGKKVSFFLYPDKAEATNETLRAQKLEDYATELAVSGAEEIFSVGRDPRWNELFYRDGIHPTEKGTEVLAHIIHSPMQEDILLKKASSLSIVVPKIEQQFK